MSRVPRLLSAFVVALLLVAVAVAVSRTRTGGSEARDPVAASPTPTAPGTAEPTPDPSVPADPGALLRDPDLAEGADPENVLAAGLAVAAGDWADLGSPAWPATERPVYVAVATITDRSRVDADVTIAFRSVQGTDRVVLRLLPAASALTDVVGPPTVTVRRAGRAAPHEVDRAGARLIVTLDPPLAAGEAVSLRVGLGYDVPARERILDDGGPAGFGLLATNPEVTLLGHWLPLLTLPDNDGPMVPWGDVGAFPAAVWSVQVEHGDGALVTGGADGPCPTRVGVDGCTWARGIALRDVSAAVYADDATVVDGDADGVLVRSWVPPSVGQPRSQAALDESIVATELFAELFGPLAWRELDVVAAPLSSGAAGMEFPGLIVIRDDTYGALGGGFGTYVIAHEVAHQWFHALLANGSLSDPVVDESLAQYASVLYYDAVYGEAAARDLTARYMRNRAQRYRDAGGVTEPAAQPLPEFSGSSSYGPIVYGRAPLGWIDAEASVGRDAVVGFLAELIRTYGLDTVITDDDVLAAAGPGLAPFLECYWFSATWDCG